MRIAVMQPYFLPYIGYFQLITAVEKLVLLDDVNYINKGWINRNRILINGKSNFITIPLEKASQNRLIKDISISPDTKWKFKILKTIESSYRKAPFYTFVYPLIEKIILFDNSSISAFVYNSLKEILNYLENNTEIIKSSALYNNRDLKAQDKIIDICLKEKATRYINPEGGADLYNKEKFHERKIELKFLKPYLPQYKQFSADFIPALSIVDVLMFNPRETIKEFIKKYELF